MAKAIFVHLNLSFVCDAMSRTENWRDPPFTSFACAGSHVGLCAVDMSSTNVLR